MSRSGRFRLGLKAAAPLPYPGQKVVQLVGGVAGEPRDHVRHPGALIHIVQAAGDDEGDHDCGALAAAVGTGEEPAFSSEGHLAVILPMSRQMLLCITDGIRFMDDGCAVSSSS